MLPRLGGTAGLGGFINVLFGELSISCDAEDVDEMDVERNDDDEALLLLLFRSMMVGFGMADVDDEDDDVWLP